MLNGPTGHWVQMLSELAVRDGIDTFVLFSDDPLTLERFARDVIPALLDAVAQQR